MRQPFAVAIAISIAAIFAERNRIMAEESTGAGQQPTLCVGHYQTEEEGKAQLARFAAAYSTREEWEARAANIRRCLLRGANLDPLPRRTPLNAV